MCVCVCMYVTVSAVSPHEYSKPSDASTGDSKKHRYVIFLLIGSEKRHISTLSLSISGLHVLFEIPLNFTAIYKTPHTFQNNRYQND